MVNGWQQVGPHETTTAAKRFDDPSNERALTATCDTP
jgi:hypothetical protein